MQRQGARFGRLPVETLSPEDFPTLHWLRRRWDEGDGLLGAFVSSFTDRSLVRTVTYTWPRARPRTRPLWPLPIHVVNHATRHRSELAMFLTTKGLSPGNLDFLGFIRSREKS